MTLWQCKIITPDGTRTEIISGDEHLSNYIDHDLLERGEVGIVIQKQVPNGKTPLPRRARSQNIEVRKKPWWKFW